MFNVIRLNIFAYQLCALYLYPFLCVPMGQRYLVLPSSQRIKAVTLNLEFRKQCGSMGSSERLHERSRESKLRQAG